MTSLNLNYPLKALFPNAATLWISTLTLNLGSGGTIQSIAFCPWPPKIHILTCKMYSVHPNNPKSQVIQGRRSMWREDHGREDHGSLASLRDSQYVWRVESRVAWWEGDPRGGWNSRGVTQRAEAPSGGHMGTQTEVSVT